MTWQSSPNVTIEGTPTVEIEGTPNVNITNATVNIGGQVATTKDITELQATSYISAGATGGPFTQVMPSAAEGYLLELVPQHLGTEIYAADVEIVHVDSIGTSIAVETVTVSNLQNLGNQCCVIRGRLLGASIQVTVVNAASAWINAVSGGAGLVADGAILKIFSLSTYVPGTGKRVPVIQESDGLLLPSSNQVPIAAANDSTEIIGVIPDYTGAVLLHAYNGGPANSIFQPWIKCFTVSFGTTELSDIYGPQLSVGDQCAQEISLPSTFNVAWIINRGTVAQTQGYSLIIMSPDQ